LPQLQSRHHAESEEVAGSDFLVRDLAV